MKITAEVREFAKAQEAAASPSPQRGEGGPRSPGEREGERVLTVQEAEAGMAEMSKRFHDEGGEIYLPAEE
jgi:hypothetical protein